MKLIIMILLASGPLFASGSNDPNFPPSPTSGKNVKATHPVTNVDKDFAVNSYFGVPSGAKFDNFELLSPAPCVEASGSYNKYSVTVDKPTVATKYVLVSTEGGQPRMGPGVHPGFTAHAIGKAAPQNAVVWLPGNSVNDCHTVLTSITTGSDFFMACMSCYNSTNTTSTMTQACFATIEALAQPGAGKTASCGSAT